MSMQYYLYFCKLLDKKPEYIFVDSEKKIPFNIKNTLNTNKKNLSIYDIDLGHLISICSKNIRFSKILRVRVFPMVVAFFSSLVGGPTPYSTHTIADKKAALSFFVFFVPR